MTDNKPGFCIISPGNYLVQSFLSVLTPGEVEKGSLWNDNYTFTGTNKYCLHINNTPAKEVAQFAPQHKAGNIIRMHQCMLIIKH